MQNRKVSLEEEADRLRSENRRLRSRPYGILTALEEARGLYRGGWSNARIAEKLGFAIDEVRKMTR